MKEIAGLNLGNQNIIKNMIQQVLFGNMKSVVRFVNPKCVIKVTLHGSRRANDTSGNAIITIGVPNIQEKKFITDCQKAKMKFPIRRLQILWDKGFTPIQKHRIVKVKKNKSKK